tara:strand:+ start:177 stop:569 length:393 start_codon:yes stop_codon:yes gene_type:complete
MKKFKELTSELVERKALSIATRRKMGRRMAKMAKSSAFKAKVARKKKKLATPDMLHKRALKAAKAVILQKFAGLSPAKYMQLSPAARVEIDNRIVSKKGAAIQKIAKKMMVKLKKQELERLKKVKQGGDK